YEDFPYAQKWNALLRPLVFERRRWEPRVVALDDGAFQAKCDAILAYATQVRAIFSGGGDMEFKVRRYARRVGGERLWKRKA
ncbi:MAG: hypothetical protein V1873_06960, partial [Verrucomicrobiota bacterium]